MERLRQSAKKKNQGQALPTVFNSLAAQGIHWYRGAVVLTGAAPGVGKSAFALSHALSVGVPTLYVSMDTPRNLTVLRAGQHLTESTQDVVETELELEVGNVWDAFDSADHIACFFRTGVYVDEIHLMLKAYAEIHGNFPELLIVDNLRNITFDGDSEYHAHQAIMAELDTLAKDTDICIHVLCHVQGTYNAGNIPIPQSGLKNQIADLPHTVLTLTRTEIDFQLMVAPVKVRQGFSDASGATRYPLYCDMSKMVVRDAA